MTETLQTRSKSLDYHINESPEKWYKALLRGFNSIIRKKNKIKLEKLIYTQKDDIFSKFYFGKYSKSKVLPKQKMKHKIYYRRPTSIQSIRYFNRKTVIMNRALQDVLNNFPEVEKSLILLSNALINDIFKYELISIAEEIHQNNKYPIVFQNVYKNEQNKNNEALDCLHQEFFIEWPFDQVNIENKDVQISKSHFNTKNNYNEKITNSSNLFLIQRNEDTLLNRNFEDIPFCDEHYIKPTTPDINMKNIEVRKEAFCTISISSISSDEGTYNLDDTNETLSNFKNKSKRKTENSMHFDNELNKFIENDRNQNLVKLCQGDNIDISEKSSSLSSSLEKSNLLSSMYFSSYRDSLNGLLTSQSTIQIDVEMPIAFGKNQIINCPYSSDITLNNKSINTFSEFDLYSQEKIYDLSSTNPVSTKPENFNENNHWKLKTILENTKYAKDAALDDTLFWGIVTETTPNTKLSELNDPKDSAIVNVVDEITNMETICPIELNSPIAYSKPQIIKHISKKTYNFKKKSYLSSKKFLGLTKNSRFKSQKKPKNKIVQPKYLEDKMKH